MSRRASFWPLRDLPVLGWLLATAAVALVHPFVPAPRWLMIHLLLLGAASHAIVVWSRHFAETLLHAPPEPRVGQARRLLLLDGGALLVVAGVVAPAWPVTVVGATAVATAVAWHGWSLGRRLRPALGSRFAGTVRHYVAAACFLPIGATIGVILARDPADPWHARLMVAHALVNLLGWVGLTVVGTLVTLWPTILRTRIADGAERQAARALPVLVGALVVGAGAALAGLRLVAAAGVVAYAVGLCLNGRAIMVALRTKPPVSFPGCSVLAGLVWLVTGVVFLAGGLALAPSWVAAADALGRVTPLLAVGFAAQVLLGALSYLLPVALGGGPTPVRAANAVLDRGAPLRLVLVNGGLLLCLLPVPSAVRVLGSALVLGALVAFLPLVVVAVRASRRAAAVPVEERPVARDPQREGADRPRGQVAGLVGVGLAALVLATAAGVAFDPLSSGAGAASASAGRAATGHTTTVRVEAKDMRFTPSSIEVPAGDRLVIELHNTDDSDVHDLVLDSGADSGRLAPGASARVDVGVVGRDLEGWCSVVGHRQMGMTFEVRVTGGAAAVAQPASDSSASGHGSASPDHADHTDLTHLDAEPAVEAQDAVLPPLPAGHVQRRTFTVRDVVREVAPGVTQRLWAYDGRVPGPVLHGRVGDRFVVRLVNRGSVSHSIDFHAGSLAPDGPMRTIAPGESLVYRFTATRAGIWMYHCSTMPMSAHIANGLFGAVVIEPPGLPQVDRSYVLVQSELYLGEDGETVDAAKVSAEQPDLVVFNGYAAQYDHQPLPARVGERVRVWVLDVGPNRATAFHVVGGQFDTTYAEGAYLLRRGAGAAGGAAGGAQSLALQPSQGGFVELRLPERGHYPFVSHVMVDAERGAHGLFHVVD